MNSLANQKKKTQNTGKTGCDLLGPPRNLLPLSVISKPPDKSTLTTASYAIGQTHSHPPHSWSALTPDRCTRAPLFLAWGTRGCRLQARMHDH